MSISVVDPISPAIERAGRVCFRPFDLGKWFTIGFCAFLANFAEGGVNIPSFNFNYRTSIGRPGGKTFAEDLRAGIDWVQAHLTPILVIGSIVLLLSIALGAVFTWLGSRGQFMFIDNIVRNRATVVAPWSKYRKEGNSLFLFRFLLGLPFLAAILAVPAGALYLALPDIQTQTFGSAAKNGLAILIIGFLLVVLVSWFVALCLNDFVVPIMFVRRIGVIEACRVFLDEMLAGHVGTFVLYLLFKILISFTVSLLMAMLMCCTLCIAAIPYLGTHVLLLPIHVFLRSYSLFFIEQFGPQWQLFSTAPVYTAELIDEADERSDERIRPGDEHYRPDDDFNLPPDDRIRPE